MAPNQMRVLKNELDRLLEGGFIIQVTNIEWVSPVNIVPKKMESGKFVSIIKL
jgi:hypothetical protein